MNGLARRIRPVPQIRRIVALLAVTALAVGCATAQPRGGRTTMRDKTAKGAGIGGAAGAVGAVLIGMREADEILVGAAIGAIVGGGIGAYMDAQEEKLGHIPGTTTERVDRSTLLKARENPAAYGDLVVRVGGYSDYFTRLSPSMQDEIIARTEHGV